MKKISLLLTALFIFAGVSFAQTNATVDLNDDVYQVLKLAEDTGLCDRLPNVRPYTQKFITNTLQQIVDNLEDKEAPESQINVYKTQINKYKEQAGVNLKDAYVRFETDYNDIPFTLTFRDSIYSEVSTGAYTDSGFNSTAYQVWNNFNFYGDLGNNVSYRSTAFVGVTHVPIEYLGKYDIGKWEYQSDRNRAGAVAVSPLPERNINKYRINSYLPFAYEKYWDGSCYYIGNLNADGLKSWPTQMALGFGFFGDLHGSFLDNKIEIGVSRTRREWAAMDNGSSLVLNSKARPFLGFDLEVRPFNWLALSSVTGVLEFPNQNHVNNNALYDVKDDGSEMRTDPDRNNDPVGDDSLFFQNAFSLAMLDIDLKYLHFDFGAGCVWPKRFEMGYGFPLINSVVYQNNVGDYDNLSLFTDIKLQYPGLGSVWFSAYLDELNAFKTRFWEKTRCMYAYQAGGKVVVPAMPLTTVSLRYTKIEPYCYTHQSINNIPYYDHYICESYTNNGYSLGYYLDPNSDEFNVTFETRAIDYTTLSFNYQLIRHAVDWGSKSIIGSNIYSELQRNDRDTVPNKYFLKDGCYEWSNIFSVYAAYDCRKFNLPVQVYANVGYIYDWFTDINGEPAADQKFHYFSSDEYKERSGVVVTVGCSLFKF